MLDEWMVNFRRHKYFLTEMWCGQNVYCLGVVDHHSNT